MRKLLAILTLLLLIVSCQNKTIKSDNPLIKDPKNMANLLFDIHLTEGMESSNFIKSNECKIIYSKILLKHKLKPEQFDSAIVYYANNNNEHKFVYELVSKKIDSYLAICDKKFFRQYPTENINYWKDYAVFPDSLQKMTQFLPFYICPRPEYLDKPLIIEK